MTNLSEIVFKKVCRTCLSCSEDMKSLYEASSSSMPISFAEMLMKFTPLKFFGYDGLPRHICYNCIAVLNRSYTFQLQCVESDTTLRKDIEKDVLSKERSMFTESMLGDPNDKIEKQDNMKIKPLIKPIIQNPLAHIKSLNQNTHNNSNTYNSDDVKSKTAMKRKMPSEPSQTNSKTLTQNKPYTKIRFSCNICPMSFTESTHFEAHIRSHNGGKLFVCTVCNQMFKKNRALVRHHMFAHSPENEEYEESPARKRARLQFHNISEMQEDLNQGEKIENSITRTKSFNLHDSKIDSQIIKLTRNVNNDEVPSERIWYTCKICTESFTHRNHLRAHMLDHARIYQFGCSVCHCRFARLQNLVRHNRRVHPPNEPENKTKNEDIVVEANIEMESNSTRSCITKPIPVPGKSVKTPLALSEKLKDLNQEIDSSKIKDNTHNSPNSKKEMNNTKIPSESRLTNSKSLKHTNVELPPKNKYSCTICSISFPWQNDLALHIRNHAVGTLFPCRICHNQFKRYRYLVQHHSLQHNPEKPVITTKFEGNSTKSQCSNVPAIWDNNKNSQLVNQDINIEMKDNMDSNSITKPGHPFNTPLAFSERLTGLNQELDLLNPAVDNYTKIKPPMNQVTHSKMNDSLNAKCIGANNSHDSIEMNKTDIRSESRQTNSKSLNQNNLTNDVPSKEIFSCLMCPKSFPLKNNLWFHIRSHTGFVCQICTKSFTKERHLNRHFKQVHGSETTKSVLLLAETQTVNQNINVNINSGIEKEINVPEKPLNTPLTFSEIKKDLNQELDFIKHEIEDDEIIPPMNQIKISEIHSPALSKLYYDSNIEDNSTKYNDIKIEVKESSEIPSSTYNKSLNQNNNFTDGIQP